MKLFIVALAVAMFVAILIGLTVGLLVLVVMPLLEEIGDGLVEDYRAYREQKKEEKENGRDERSV